MCDRECCTGCGSVCGIEDATVNVNANANAKTNNKETCGHYVSGCKIIAKCCNKDYGCRVCHDFENTDHEINRYEIEEIICNNCRLRQPI